MKDNSGEMYQFHFERKAAMDKYDDPVGWKNFPEMQSREVKNFRKEYFKEADEAICKQIDGLLQNLDVDTGRLRGLTSGFHDEDVREKYFKKIDKIACQQIDKIFQDADVSVEKLCSTVNTLHDKDLVKEYLARMDEYICNRIDYLLKKDSSGVIPESNLEEARRLIGRLRDDEDLILKYSEIVNKNYLEQFYTNITPTLVQDSTSLNYLRPCTGMISISIPEKVKTLGWACFAGQRALHDISIPGSIQMSTYCFSNCVNLRSATISKGISEISDGCFQKCSSLTEVNLSDTIKDIGNSAFYNCTSLQNIDIPKGVERLGRACFEDCTSLKDLVLPPHLKDIGTCCFGGCTSLKSIRIPNSIEQLKDYTFDSCAGLMSVYLPRSIKIIETSCFYDCRALKDVYYGGSEEDRERIEISKDNEYLLNATWHYNYKGNSLE